MAKIFRALLIAAVNTIKEFFAFATKECLEAGLKNATNNGCTDLGDGIYQGGAGHNMVANVGTDIQTASKWEICCRYNNQSASDYPTIFAPVDGSYTQNPFLQLVSNKMYLFLKDVNGNDIIQGDTDYTLPSGFHLIQVGWTGTKYYMNVDGDEKWYYNSSVATKSNQNIMFLNLTNQSTHWGYSIDMSETYIIIDNVTTYFYSTIPEVNDNINLNDGMATSNYDWSAYPVGVKNGTYTQTGTVEQIKEVDGNTVYVTQEPEQDNKDATINTGKIYYAYTNANDESVYTIDNPIDEGGFILENATVVGGLTNNNGVYSDFSQNNYIKLNTSSPTNSLEFIIAFIPNSTSPGDILRSQPDGAGILLRNSDCYLSSTGSGWNVLSGFSTGLTYTTGVLNYIKITWDSTNGIYTFWQSLDGETWTEKYSSDSGKAAVYWNNTQTLGACSSYSEYFNGSIDLTKTKAVIDGVTINFGYFSNPSVLYDDEFTQLNPQPTFTIQEAGLVDANKVGDLIDTNGVYSGFGNNNYISANNALPASITSADIIFKAKITSFDDHSVLMGNKNTEQYYGIRKYKKFSIYNSGWTEGTNELDANKFYWFRVIFDGTTWTGYTIEDSNYTFATLPEISQWNTEWTTTENGAASWIKGASYNIGRNPFASGEYMHGDIDMTETKLTINGIEIVLYNNITGITVTSEIPNITYNKNTDNNKIKSIECTINTVDNTTIQAVTITSDQTAEIETSTSVTTSNNNVAITDGSYHLFNITVPSSLTSIMQNGGQQFDITYCPYLFKHNTGVGLLLKNGNNVYYRNSWIMNKSYDLHYQQINFSYPRGATVTCKINNVTTDLTPYCYPGDIITWSCDNAGVVTTGTYTVKYNSADGNIQTITIS